MSTSELSTTELSTSDLSSSGLTISPLSGFTGALIDGADLSVPLPHEQLEAIRAALHRWKVVFFRGQELDHASQVAFGTQFGDVTPGHPYEGDSAPAGFPQIHTVSPAAYDHRYGTRYRKRQSPNGPGWHADVTPLINPPSHSILRAERVPDYGGDTQFTNVAAAYAGLSPSVRALVDELRAEHRFGASTSAERSAEKIGDLVRSNPLATIHPVVRVHPETGEKVLYVNPSFTREIVNLSPSGEQAPAGSALRGDRAARILGAVQVGSRAVSRSGTTGPPCIWPRATSSTSKAIGCCIASRWWATFRWAPMVLPRSQFRAITSGPPDMSILMSRPAGTPRAGAAIGLVDPRAAVRRVQRKPAVLARCSGCWVRSCWWACGSCSPPSASSTSVRCLRPPGCSVPRGP